MLVSSDTTHPSGSIPPINLAQVTREAAPNEARRRGDQDARSAAAEGAEGSTVRFYPRGGRQSPMSGTRTIFCDLRNCKMRFLKENKMRAHNQQTWSVEFRSFFREMAFAQEGHDSRRPNAH